MTTCQLWSHDSDEHHLVFECKCSGKVDVWGRSICFINRGGWLGKLGFVSYEDNDAVLAQQSK